MKPHTYVRRFSVGGLCATLTAYPTGEMACNWNRPPTKEQIDAILPEYLDFKRDALQTLANETGSKILGIVSTGPDKHWMADFTPENTI